MPAGPSSHRHLNSRQSCKLFCTIACWNINCIKMYLSQDLAERTSSHERLILGLLVCFASWVGLRRIRSVTNASVSRGSILTLVHRSVALLCTGSSFIPLRGSLAHLFNVHRVYPGYGSAILATDTYVKLRLTRSMVGAIHGTCVEDTSLTFPIRIRCSNGSELGK